MKKKLLVFCVLAMAIMCLFAISISAAETKTVDGITYYLYQNGSNYYCEATNANKSCTLETVIIPETITGSDGNEYTFIQVNQEAFCDNKTIKYVSLPATLKTVKPSAFRGCTNLQFVDFNDNQNDVLFDNWGHFMGCTSLKAVSMPTNTDVITNRMFSKCTNLKAVYLPSATVTIESNGYGEHSSFSYCNNVYFVNEPFEVRDENGNFYGDNFEMPTRPDVYFFPSGLVNIFKRDSGVGFAQCYNLNPVMVFPTTLTQLWVNDGVFYECGATGNTFTVVFLGNMTDVRIGFRDKRATGVSYVFANPNDKTLNDVNIVDTSPAYTPTIGENDSIYFCHSNKYFKLFNLGGSNDASTFTESNVTYSTGVPHVANPNLTEAIEATCVTNRGETTYCFCGAKIGTVEVENTALGHDHDESNEDAKLSISYLNYLENGTLKVQCSRCDNVKDVAVDPIISSFKGFSTKEEGSGLTFGYTLDLEAIKEYEAVNGKTLEFGFVVAVQAFLGENAPLNENGEAASDKVIKASITSEDYTYTGADFRLTGNWDGTANVNGEEVAVKDIKFYMAGYIIDGASVVYINDGATGNSADAYSYRDIAGTEVVPEEIPAE